VVTDTLSLSLSAVSRWSWCMYICTYIKTGSRRDHGCSSQSAS